MDTITQFAPTFNNSYSNQTTIEIIDLRLCGPSSNQVRAVATVRAGRWTVDVRVVRRGRRHVIEFPSRWDGVQWVSQARPDPDLNIALTDIVLEAFKAAALRGRC